MCCFYTPAQWMTPYLHGAAGDKRAIVPPGQRVIELGPGLGALTRVLLRDHPEMLAIELDGRAVELLRERHAGLTVLESDVLQVRSGAAATRDRDDRRRRALAAPRFRFVIVAAVSR